MPKNFPVVAKFDAALVVVLLALAIVVFKAAGSMEVGAQHLKDVGLIRALAARCRAATPLRDVHEDLLRQAVARGLGDADNSAISEVFFRDRSCELEPGN